MSKQITEGRILRQRTGFDLAPGSFEGAQQVSKLLAGSGMVPDAYKGRPRDIFVAIAMGFELGLQPLQALQGIAVINGSPAVWGDALIAIVMSHPDYEDMSETFDPKSMIATCVAKRRGRSPVTRTFSKADAERAGLWGKKSKSGKPTPWVLYPQRMLQMRARSWALRDLFADALKGIRSAEEIIDITPSEPARYDTDDDGPQDLASRLAEQAGAVTTREGPDDVETESDPEIPEPRASEPRPVEHRGELPPETDDDAYPAEPENASAEDEREAQPDEEQAIPPDPDRLVHAEILEAIHACETQDQLSHIKPLIERTDEPDRVAELRRAAREQAKAIAAGDGG